MMGMSLKCKVEHFYDNVNIYYYNKISYFSYNFLFWKYKMSHHMSSKVPNYQEIVRN